MDISAITGGLILFCLRLTDVSLGTMCTILTIRGQKVLAALLGFIEVTIWVIAISRVLSSLDNVWSIVGYSSGFAAGTLVGMAIEERLALGYVGIHIISRQKGNEIAQALREAGYGVTMTIGHGQSGPVTMLNAVVRRKNAPGALEVVASVDSDAFVTLEEARYVRRGYTRLGK
jgi:uncharacterized protein YebE (UPF0316 family)